MLGMKPDPDGDILQAVLILLMLLLLAFIFMKPGWHPPGSSLEQELRQDLETLKP